MQENRLSKKELYSLFPDANDSQLKLYKQRIEEKMVDGQTKTDVIKEIILERSISVKDNSSKT